MRELSAIEEDFGKGGLREKVWQCLKHMCFNSFLLVDAQGEKTKVQQVATSKGDCAREKGESLFQENKRGRSWD